MPVSRVILALLQPQEDVDQSLADLGWDCRLKVQAHYGMTVAGTFDDGERVFFDVWRVKNMAYLNAHIVGRATDLRARHGFKMPDAIHLATAFESSAAEFCTANP